MAPSTTATLFSFIPPSNTFATGANAAVAAINLAAAPSCLIAAFRSHGLRRLWNLAGKQLCLTS